MPDNHSDTYWLQLLKDGDGDAAGELWERCIRRMLGLARRKLSAGQRRIADEEDVAVSAFHSFCRGAAEGRFASLEDRHDLWQVLAVITSRKAGHQLQKERAQKRGSGDVRGESAFASHENSGPGLAGAASDEPTPEYAAMVEEQFERLLDQLEDPTLQQVTLLKLEGFTNVEIADRLNRNVRSIERKLQLIRRHWTDE